MEVDVDVVAVAGGCGGEPNETQATAPHSSLPKQYRMLCLMLDVAVAVVAAGCMLSLTGMAGAARYAAT